MIGQKRRRRYLEEPPNQALEADQKSPPRGLSWPLKLGHWASIPLNHLFDRDEENEMSLWSRIFGEKDDFKQVERPSVIKPPSAELIPEEFEIQVPWLSAGLLNILESIATNEPLVAWKVKAGAAVQSRAIIAEFRLNWKGVETGNVYPHRRSEILTGSVEMPFNGIVRFGSTDKSDKCFCSLQPLLDEENTFRYKRQYKGTEKANHEDWLRYLVSPHSFYFPACEAIWLILEHRDRSSGEHGDPNDLINQEIKTIKTTVLERAGGG